MGNRVGQQNGSSFIPSKSSNSASAVLSKQLNAILKSNTEQEGYRVELVDDNLYQWRVHLFNFPPDVQLAYAYKVFSSSENSNTSHTLPPLFALSTSS